MGDEMKLSERLILCDASAWFVKEVQQMEEEIELLKSINLDVYRIVGSERDELREVVKLFLGTDSTFTEATLNTVDEIAVKGTQARPNHCKSKTRTRRRMKLIGVSDGISDVA